MTTDEKIILIRQVGEEIISEEELKKLLESGEQLIAYDGFEPSGQMHIAQGILRAINVNKITSCGIKFKFLVGDWHAYLNNKLGGDLEKIKTTGKYFIEVWRAAGMDLSQVEFVWASDIVKDPKYWELVMKIAKTNGIRRFVRGAEIMGREESMDLTLAQLMYVAMQTADIFYLGAKITELGLDQRKVNMLAREIGPQLGFYKPVVISHHMLMGLVKSEILNPKSETNPNNQNSKRLENLNLKNSEIVSSLDISASNLSDDKLSRTIALKMSKSNPDSAIFMTDSAADIKRKIDKAYCPEGIVEDNPILEYCKYILFERFDKLTIERPEKYGGPVILSDAKDLEREFAAKKIHPQDLKQTVAKLLDELIEPVRKHFETDEKAKNLLKEVENFKVTR